MSNPTTTTPYFTPRRCTGPNHQCRAAAKAGRVMHIIPREAGLVLPTYHYECTEDAVAAVLEATATAPTVTSDADLYRYRAQGVAHRLPVGWVDPTRRGFDRTTR